MGVSQKIEHIHEYLLSKADDRFINLIYGMIEAETASQPYELSDAQKAILDQRLDAHSKNPSAGKSWVEVKSSLLSKYK